MIHKARLNQIVDYAYSGSAVQSIAATFDAPADFRPFVVHWAIRGSAVFDPLIYCRPNGVAESADHSTFRQVLFGTASLANGKISSAIQIASGGAEVDAIGYTGELRFRYEDVFDIWVVNFETIMWQDGATNATQIARRSFGSATWGAASDITSIEIRQTSGTEITSGSIRAYLAP